MEEELLDEFFQLGDDLTPNVVAEFGELGNGRDTPRWPFWVKRYTEGEIRMHVHHRVRSCDGNFHHTDRCAVYERAGAGQQSPLIRSNVYVLHGCPVADGRPFQKGTRLV